MKKFINWIKSLFDNKKKYVHIAVNIVQAVKKAIEHKTFDIIKDVAKSLLPEAGDEILDKAVSIAEKEIPVLLLQLQIIENTIDAENDEQVVQLLLEMDDKTWAEFTSGLAGNVYVSFTDGIDGKEAKKIAKEYYDKNIKK